MFTQLLILRLIRFQRTGRKLLKKIEDQELWRSEDASLSATLIRNGSLMQLYYGDLGGADQYLSIAEGLLTNKVQDFYQLAMARSWRSFSLFQLGNLKAAAILAREVFSATVDAGQNRIAQQTLAVWTRTCEGRLPFDQLRSCLRPVNEDIPGTIELLGAEARWHLAFGRTKKALAAAQEMIALDKRHRLFYPPNFLANAFFIRCLREHAKSIEETRPKESRQLMQLALRRAHRLGRKSWQHIALPANSREIAIVSDSLGKTRRGLKYAHKSCEIAEKQGARYELALSRLVVAELSRKLGLPEADRLLAVAKAEMAEFEKMIEENTAVWNKRSVPSELLALN